MSGIFSTPTVSALSLLTIGAGVPAGASRPFQPTLMTPGTVSSIVGVSGSSGSRVFSAAAMMRIVPACACGSATGKVLKAHFEVAGEQVLHQRRAAAVGEMHHVDPDFLFE